MISSRFMHLFRRPFLRPLRRMDLTVKLLVMMLCLSLLSLGSIYLIWMYSEQAFIKQVEDNVSELSKAIQISVEQLTSTEGTDEAKLQDYVGRLKKKGVKEISIVSNEEEIIASSDPKKVGGRLDPKQKDLLITARFGAEEPSVVPHRYYNLLVPVVVDKQQQGYVHVILVLDDYDWMLRSNNFTRLAAMGAIFSFGILAAVVLARRYTRPIDQVVEAAKSVAAGRLVEMKPPQAGGEIADLVQSFNEMVSKLRQNKELEQRLRQAEHFSAMGHLAAGIAHEIRNPLNMISLGIDHLKHEIAALNSGNGRPADAAALHAQLESLTGTMKDEIVRLNQLVENFLQHGKTPDVTLREQPPAPLLRDVVRLAEQKAREQGIECRAEFGDDLPAVRMDEAQLKGCLMNVVLNAIQAMPEGGVLSVEATSVPRAPASDAVPAGTEHGAGWLEIRVRDTGSGIAPDEVERVCEPYFTTKSLGIGLGLSLAKRMIEEHGGHLAVASELGRGTMVTLWLPVASGSAAAPATGASRMGGGDEA
jgi:signal transduction histidine kinase